MLVLLTSGTALLATAALVATAAIVPPIGARRAARSVAQAEIAALLAPDERIRSRLFTSQRLWTDVWRDAFGVLVVTDRRLLHVAIPPTPVLRPREDGPQEFRITSLGFDEAFTIESRASDAGPTDMARGLHLVLRTATMRMDLFVDPAAKRTVQALIEATKRGRRALGRAERHLENTTRPPAPPPERYDTHAVQRGETLTGLARRYRTSPDILRQLNQLAFDTIRVGQRLRVPARPDTTAMPTDSLPRPTP